MVDTVSGLRHHISLSPKQLLYEDEVIVIVDDELVIRDPLKIYLEDQGFDVEAVADAESLSALLETRNVALVLLDIGLPDVDGRTLLPEIATKYPNVAIVMLTGVADLKVALECIRDGADDYLSKPAQFNEILFVVKRTLEKRRLVFENRKYQEDLEKAHFRIHVLHQLSLKMNTAYLSTVEVDEILQAILVGITASEGLRFNRAFLAMFDEDGKVLRGRMAIGPNCRDEAGKIWEEIQSKELSFLDIVHDLRDNCKDDDFQVNQIVKNLRVDVADTDNILIKSAFERRSIRVDAANGCIPEPLERRSLEPLAVGRRNKHVPTERRQQDDEADRGPMAVPRELMELLAEDSFIVVPLYSPSRSFGVIIADHFVTKQKIMSSHISALELFASQASLAIEHSHLYMDMQKKIGELEDLNDELDKNKDLLVEAERYAALGQMSAQLVHAIRNPITSIGGVSRILAKKTSDDEWLKYLNVIIKETSRLESTLEDLFDFVDQTELDCESASLFNILRKTLMLVQQNMLRQNISWELDVPDQDLEISVDLKQIRQVFIHLIRNAIEAMPSGGKLTVSVRSDDEWATISIIDTGIGMPDTYVDKAKDAFFTTKTYGTGMGLTMVERVLKAHDGNFSINRRDIGGMEVLVRLPLHAEIPQAQRIVG